MLTSTKYIFPVMNGGLSIIIGFAFPGFVYPHSKSEINQ